MSLCRLLLCGIAALLTSDVVHAGDSDFDPGLGIRDFGSETRGGRGGAVIRITNLNADGPGSLKEALETEGPRVVVFEVGGVIDLEMTSLRIREPFLTVAGQTAPSPGITIIRGGMSISAHDVVMRHIRVRPGDAGQPKKSGWEPDGITTSGGGAYNVVIDHCSVTWAVDENISASGSRTVGPDSTSHRITIRNCIIAEGLSDASHAKGPHSKGTLIHDFCRDIAVVGNLYAHNVMRNPYFKAFTTGVIVNNLIYNPGRVAIQLYYVNREWEHTNIEPKNAKVSMVGNVMIHGVDTPDSLAFVVGRGDAFLEDNIALDRNGQPVSETGRPGRWGEVVVLQEKPVWPVGLVARPASEVADYVTKHAGARPGERDDIDRRIVSDFLTREGRVIDSQEEVGGYPDHAMTRHVLELPEKNIGVWLDSLAVELEN